MFKRRIALIALVLAMFPFSSVQATEVEEARAKYEEYQKQIDEKMAEVMSFNNDIQSKVLSIEENNNKINVLQEDIKESELKIVELKQHIDEVSSMKDSRIREYYKNGGSLTYINLLLDMDNFSDFFTKLQALKTVVGLDKEIIDKYTTAKTSLDEEILNQQQKIDELESSNEAIAEDTKLLEEQKAEQEKALAELEAEKAKFEDEVLVIAEKEVIAPQITSIEDNWDSVDNLKSAVSQLESVSSNQLVSEEVIAQATENIAKAKDRIAELELQEAEAKSRAEAQAQVQAQASVPVVAPKPSNINRGDSSSISAQDLLSYAYQFIGVPYVWGGTTPDGFDCSGFTSYVYRHAAGIEITRTTYTQINVGTPVAYEDMQPGDLVFTYGNEHVGIYVGEGKYINATTPGSIVKISNVTNFYAARRIL